MDNIREAQDNLQNLMKKMNEPHIEGEVIDEGNGVAFIKGEGDTVTICMTAEVLQKAKETYYEIYGRSFDDPRKD